MDNRPKRWTRLIDARKLRGYTQGQMAEACDVALLTYGRWERLEFEPSVSQIRAIAFLLDVPVGWLVGDVEFEPFADIEYWSNVSKARQLIIGARDNPSSFLFGEGRGPVTREDILAWVTEKMELPAEYFETKDIITAFPKELRYMEGDNDEAERYFPIIPLKEDSKPAQKAKARRR